MKIVITGALGYIGSKLLHSIHEAHPHAEFVLIDNFSYAARETLCLIPQTMTRRFVELDFLNPGAASYCKDADYLIHLAAWVDPTNYRLNMGTNHSLLSKAAEISLRENCCLVFPSSTSVYGISQLQICETMDEDTIFPQTEYARDKRESELLLLSLRNQGLRFIGFRFATVFGVAPQMRTHTAVNKFCYDAFTKSRVNVWATALNQIRPYLDLDDCARCLIHATQDKLRCGYFYNAATTHLSVNQLLDQIKKQIPFEISLEHSERMNQLSYEVSTKALSQTGFEFQGSLRRGIKDILTWTRLQQNLPLSQI